MKEGIPDRLTKKALAYFKSWEVKGGPHIEIDVPNINTCVSKVFFMLR